MALDLAQLIEQLHADDEHKRPPIHQWDPQQSGQIDIRIDSEGNWYHEGGRFERLSLVKLLSSILRLESDGYYLVTPVEKLKITVDDSPFVVVSVLNDGDDLVLVTNTEELIPLDTGTNWQLRPYQQQPIPYVELRDGLFARLGRHVYYQLIDMAEQRPHAGGVEVVLNSGGAQFSLGFFDDE